MPLRRTSILNPWSGQRASPSVGRPLRSYWPTEPWWPTGTSQKFVSWIITNSFFWSSIIIRWCIRMKLRPFLFLFGLSCALLDWLAGPYFRKYFFLFFHKPPGSSASLQYLVNRHAAWIFRTNYAPSKGTPLGFYQRRQDRPPEFEARKPRTLPLLRQPGLLSHPPVACPAEAPSVIRVRLAEMFELVITNFIRLYRDLFQDDPRDRLPFVVSQRRSGGSPLLLRPIQLRRLKRPKSRTATTAISPLKLLRTIHPPTVRKRSDRPQSPFVSHD